MMTQTGALPGGVSIVDNQLVIAAGVFSSIISQSDAELRAANFINQILTEQTVVTCGVVPLAWNCFYGACPYYFTLADFNFTVNDHVIPSGQTLDFQLMAQNTATVDFNGYDSEIGYATLTNSTAFDQTVTVTVSSQTFSFTSTYGGSNCAMMAVLGGTLSEDGVTGYFIVTGGTSFTFYDGTTTLLVATFTLPAGQSLPLYIFGNCSLLTPMSPLAVGEPQLCTMQGIFTIVIS